jgi:hypothetical protein
MVLLDIDMPKSCSDCSLKELDVWKGKFVCKCCGSPICNLPTRMNFCPIKVEIPKDATNGDVIRGLFPKYYQTLLNYLDCTKWWNAPWKGMENEQDD